MATIVNERDKLLQAAPVRDINPSLNKSLSITANAPVIKIAQNGVATPATVTITASVINIVGDLAWSVTGASGLNVAANTRSATLSATSMAGTSATIKAEILYQGVTYVAYSVVTKVQDGLNGVPGSPGSDGADGRRGTVQTSGSSNGPWSNAAANSAISAATGGSSPIMRDVVTLTNGSSFVETRFYNGTTWLPLTAYIDGNLLVTGTVAAEAVTAGILTGQIYRTGESGQRVAINEGNNNQIFAYNSANLPIVQLGGLGYGASAGFFSGSSSLYPTLYSINTAAMPAITAYTTNNFGTALWAYSQGTGTALLVSGMADVSDIQPRSANTYNCGSASRSWANIYSNTALTVTSDARSKVEVGPLPYGLDTILQLKPRRYRMRVAEYTRVKKTIADSVGPRLPGPEPENFELVPRAGERWHFGLIAQDVETVLGLENAVVCLADKNDPASQRSLRYEELLPIVIQAIQELHARLTQRDEEIVLLQKRLKAIEDQYE